MPEISKKSTFDFSSAELLISRKCRAIAAQIAEMPNLLK